MTDLEQALIEEVRAIRAQFAEANVSDLRLDIEIDGRVLSGDLQITFRCGSDYGYEQAAGGDLSAVVDEFLRRKGWNNRHAALCLPRCAPPAEQPPLNDEIPF